MIETDYVRFLMPSSREYQFAAMAVVQQFVNGFQVKCRNHDVSNGEALYQLVYELVMPEVDLEFFKSAGLALDQLPVTFDVDCTMEIDLTDTRLNSFQASNRRHLVLACSAMCGAPSRPLPEMRRVEVRTQGPGVWLDFPTCDELLTVHDYQVTGIVGCRGPETYLAAVMGLGVVELVPFGCDPLWITKWQQLLYRLIRMGEGDEAECIAAAKRSIEATLERLVQRCSGAAAGSTE